MSRHKGSDELLRKALAGLDLIEDAERRLGDAYRNARNRYPKLLPGQQNLIAEASRKGVLAIRDIQLGHDQARTYAAVATALLLDEFMGAGEPS